MGDTNAEAPVFFRKPYSIKVQPKGPEQTCLPEFVLIGIHVRPARAYLELNGLVDVYDDSTIKYKTEDTLILGDLNAACDYFGPVDIKQNVLRQRGDFEWLVDDNRRTNVGGNRGCAYDRSAGTYIV